MASSSGWKDNLSNSPAIPGHYVGNTRKVVVKRGGKLHRAEASTNHPLWYLKDEVREPMPFISLQEHVELMAMVAAVEVVDRLLARWETTGEDDGHTTP